MIKAANRETIGEAAGLLRSGELVAFPTETVYGLGADATNDQAVAKIFAAKNRPAFNPLIVHVKDTSAAKEIVQWSQAAEDLTNKFWPGALTVILPRQPDCAISLLVSTGLDTIAVRAPDHPVAKSLLNQAGCPIAAPSANRSGRISPTIARHVDDSLGPNVNLILDDGPCRVGLESTVINLSGGPPILLRFGGIEIEALRSIVGLMPIASENSEIKSPGMLSQHYAPDAPLRLNAVRPAQGETLLAFGSDVPPEFLNLSPTGSLVEAAANLFSMLHQLDDPNSGTIAVMPIPEKGLGRAINDRLRRAAS